MRKLLPYEHQLIEELGITKEDYLTFLQVQFDYTTTPQQRLEKPQADLFVIAQVLVIIGTILQVVGALLVKPSSEGKRAPREQIFVPRLGFNSSQELAKYNDPVNLVYTNQIDHNVNGGVRVAASLVWSSIESFGSSQFMQLMLVLGAGPIYSIAPGRLCFGQTPIRQFQATNVWLYYNNNGNIKFSNLLRGDTNDPSRKAASSTDLVYRVNPSNGSRVEGFSQAFSPTSLTQCGVFSPIPLNVLVQDRLSDGALRTALLGITVNPAFVSTYWPANGSRPLVPKGTQLRIIFDQTLLTQPRYDVTQTASEKRRAFLESFDFSSIYMLGSAEFTLSSISQPDLDAGSSIVTLTCSKEGMVCKEPYERTDYRAPVPRTFRLVATFTGGTTYGTATLLSGGSNQSYPSTDANSIVKITNIDVDANSDYARFTVSGPVGTSVTFSLQNEGYPGTFYAVFGIDIENRIINYSNFFLTTVTGAVTIPANGILSIYVPLLERTNNSTEYAHTKCLVKIEKAAYETLTPCSVVDFALKARCFRRISNRSSRYGEKKVEQYKNSDNGVKLRSCFFRVQYGKSLSTLKTVNRIFVVRRGIDVENYISLKFFTGSNSSQWQLQLYPVAETAANLLFSGAVGFAYLDNTGNTQTIDNGDGTRFAFIGTLKDIKNGDLAPLDDSPAEFNEWALFSTWSDTQAQFSFDSGPEIEIKAVTEQSIETPLNTLYPDLYKNLSMIGFNAYSGRGLQDLRSVSAFVLQGKQCTVLTSPTSYVISPTSSSFAPDIFLDTITDKIDGIGRYANIDGVDIQKLYIAKQFCVNNQLFMDGIIAERTSWRQFWADVAPYSLLELARVGGKETLIPAVPVNNNGTILNAPPISALFNTGNILEDSYKEEYLDYGTNVQDLIATVIYRDTEKDEVFPRNRSVDVKLADATDAVAIRQTFNISQFVTNKNQAIMFAKLLCNQRRYIRKAIEFKTFPTDSVLSPGAYIYVDIGQAQWDNIYSGAVEAGGTLNTPISNIINGTYNVLLWKPGQSAVVPINNVSIVNNVASALAGYADWLFVLGTNVKSKRVFKITEVQMDEEGEVTVKALDHPCDTNGNSLITQGLTDVNSTLFTIR